MAPFFFDAEELRQLAAARRDDYRTADPFPHTVIDDFLPAPVIESVLDEFPGPGDIDWWAFDSDRERKLGTLDDSVMGPATRHLLAQFNSAAVLDFLAELTGIEGLVPDPHFHGGGLHQIEPGGFLRVHADFNLHPTTRLERRLNLLIYLNQNWRPEYGGALELWDREMRRCVHAIDPLWNRCVIFTTSKTSYHGHPDPLRCPAGITRKSLALYYYSLPDSSRRRVREHSTIFRSRPGEPSVETASSKPSSSGLRYVARRWLPPAIADGIRRARGRG